jgi:hypothetical protein
LNLTLQDTQVDLQFQPAIGRVCPQGGLARDLPREARQPTDVLRGGIWVVCHGLILASPSDILAAVGSSPEDRNRVGISITGGLDPDEFERDVFELAAADAEEQFAQDMAAEARTRGDSNVDHVDIDLSVVGDPDGKIPINSDRIRARANEILRGP